MFTYRHKEDGQVVKRDEIWPSAETDDNWERVDNSVTGPGPDAPRRPVNQDHVDPFELAGGAPDVDVNPGHAPGELARPEDLSRDELNGMAADLGVENPQDLPNRGKVVDAIEAAQSARAEDGQMPAPAAEVETESNGSEGDESGSDEAPEIPSKSELKEKSRDDLNDLATKLGVENASNLPNKGKVVDAIEEKRG